MFRNLCLLVCLLFAVAALAGCSRAKLNKAFSHSELTARAREAVTLLNNKEFDTLINEMIREDLQDNFRDTDLESAVNLTYGNAGEFKKFASVKIYGQKEQGTDNDCALVILLAQYENQNVAFSITFDTEMKLIDLYMK